ncbi:MAG: TRAM domain-containing protein [Armatimonadota bacterium]
MIVLRGLWSLFVASVTLVGIFAGYQIGTWLALNPKLSVDTETQEYLMFVAGLTAVGGLLGFLFAQFAFRKLVTWIQDLERVSLLDKVAAALGVVLGLVVALLATAPLGEQSLAVPIRILASVIGVILGIGFAMSTKQQLIFVFPSLATDTHLEKINIPAQPKMLDTNIIIGGRISDICATGFLEGPLLIPQFILQELRHIADSEDALKRARGRRGLEVLNKLKNMSSVDVRVYDDYPPEKEQIEVDARLVKVAKLKNAAILTNDYSVNEMAKLQQVKVLNVNELAAALKPVYLPGEEATVTIVKEGKEPGQGVAYLEDGTMVVVEEAKGLIGQDVVVSVTSSLQTAAGKMIFADLVRDAEPRQSGKKS